jgi:GLPGLI family protein
MKAKLILFICVIANMPTFAQTEGVVTYTYKEYWTKIVARMPYLSQEEKDRTKLTWGNEEDDLKGTKMKLSFSENKSVYTYADEQYVSDDGQWSGRNQEYVLQRDFAKNTKIDLMEMLGKTYIVEDSLPTIKWRIQNEIKDIAGHVCMKAITEDTIKKQKITAWFSQDILVQAGPEHYLGLPGLILELNINDGDVVIEAVKVELKKLTTELDAPKKMKGKKINMKSYNDMLIKHIKDSIKAKRNPYWAIRY